MLQVRTADNLTTFMCRLSENLGAWASWNWMGLSRGVQKLLAFYTLLIYVTMRTTHKHQIHSLPRLAHLMNYEYEQVITHILNSKYLFTKATLSLINIFHPPGRRFDTSYSNVRTIFCFTTYKYLIANTNIEGPEYELKLTILRTHFSTTSMIQSQHI
jgi:hypothetical protein